MSLSIMPLQTILYQLFFLLLAVSVEAFVLQKQLQISPRQGVEYATSINLLSIAIGWFIFFSIEGVLPDTLKLQLIIYIFFDRIPGLKENFLELMLLGTVIFFGTFLVKTIGFYLLQILLTFKTEKELAKEPDEEDAGNQLGTGAIMSTKLSSQASAILLANASSYSILLTIILLRWYWINFIEI